MTSAPWQVYVPGFPGEEHDSYPDAKRAYKRLRKLDRRRQRPSFPLGAPGSPTLEFPRPSAESAGEPAGSDPAAPNAPAAHPMSGVSSGAEGEALA